MRKRYKWTCISVAVLIIISLAGFYKLSYRYVKLEYAGSVKVEPPFTEILQEDAILAIKKGGLLDVSTGKNLKKKILVNQINHLIGV